MYVVLKEKVRNVKISDKEFKTFYPGEVLPENYEPPKDYIDQGIVGLKKSKKGGDK